jgi:hypothetical protein
MRSFSSTCFEFDGYIIVVGGYEALSALKMGNSHDLSFDRCRMDFTRGASSSQIQVDFGSGVFFLSFSIFALFKRKRSH